MERVYIFGHKNPDTDSVAAAIALSYLKNELGIKTSPRVLGDINKETEFVLKYFHVSTPKYLDNVYLQIKDVNYHKNFFVSENTSLLDAYLYMEEKQVTGLPIINVNKELVGLVTEKMLLKELISGDDKVLKTTYDNILSSIEGQEILRFDDIVEGNISAASYRSTTFMSSIDLQHDDILIVGDRHSIIEYAVNSKIKLLILVGNASIKEEHLHIAKMNKVSIIKTNNETFKTVQLIRLSKYIKDLITEKNPVIFDETVSYEDFLEETKRYKHNNYPVVNKENKCMGLIRVTDITKKNRKKVILVDHNGLDQSVSGLNEADVVEIVDHHNISDLKTSNPINIRNMAVGSTNTVVYYLYLESNIEIPSDIAGLMISGILSDTLNFTSPTTTEIDKLVVNELSNKIGLDIKKYANEMLRAGTSIEGMTIEDIVMGDFKVFPVDNKKVGIGQITTFDSETILSNVDEYKGYIESLLEKNNYDYVLFAITDILKQGSFMIYNNSFEKIVKNAFGIEDIKEGVFIKDCLSRKKQIVPYLINEMEKN